MTIFDDIQRVESIKRDIHNIKVALSKMEKRLQRLDVSAHRIWYKDYESGMTLDQVAAKYNVSATMVYTVFKDHDWVIRGRGYSQKEKAKQNEGA